MKLCLQKYRERAHLEALDEGIFMLPSYLRYNHVVFKLISMFKCALIKCLKGSFRGLFHTFSIGQKEETILYSFFISVIIYDNLL